ncbi:MAG: CinA family protein [Eubacteriales bacterium]|nr:CinA family protein [Eubacteriales bacterium]
MKNQSCDMKAVAERLTALGLTLSVAESCTGGLLSAKITDVPGASKFYKGGVCTYCNEIKHGVLGVRQETLDTYTAVSEQTAGEMAAGCARVFGTDLAVSVTGYAGPDGGEDGTPVGTIYVGICCRGAVRVECICDPSGRGNARESACKQAVLMILTETEKI